MSGSDIPRRFLKFILAPLLIVLGFGLLTNGIVLKGFALVGDASGDWGQLSCFEFNTWPVVPADSTSAGVGEFEGKDVATTTTALVPDVTFDQVVQINVTNAYPSYGVRCVIGYTISAGMDAELVAVTLIPEDNLTGCAETSDTGLDGAELNCNQLTVRFVPGNLDCGDDGEILNDLVFHVEQPAPQGSVLKFRIELTPVQCDPGDESTPTPTTPPGSQPTFTPTPTETPLAEALTARQGPSAQVQAVRTGDGGLLGMDSTTRGGLGTLMLIIGTLLIFGGGTPLAFILGNRRKLR